MDVPDGLPSLAVGSHERGSGRACVMNYISYINGDVRITDTPDCTEPVLAHIAQNINDSLCTHRESSLLCSDCSGQMLRLAPLLIGTRVSPADIEWGFASEVREFLAQRGHSFTPQVYASSAACQVILVLRRARVARYEEVYDWSSKKITRRPVIDGMGVLQDFRELLVEYRRHFGLEAAEITPEAHQRVLAQIGR